MSHKYNIYLLPHGRKIHTKPGRSLMESLMDPLDKDIMAALKTGEMLSGHDDYCMNFLTAVRAGEIEAWPIVEVYIWKLVVLFLIKISCLIGLGPGYDTVKIGTTCQVCSKNQYWWQSELMWLILPVIRISRKHLFKG